MDRQEERKHSRGLQHDTAHARHGAEAVRGVLDGQGLILRERGRERQKLKQRNAFIEQGHKVALDYICRV